MGSSLRLLLIEDNEDDAALLIRQLERGGFEVEARRVETLESLQSALLEEWDLFISDFHLPGMNGLQALKMVRETGRDRPFLMVSGVMGEEAAVGAMRAGAHDYILKDNTARLVPAVNRELREAVERSARLKAEEALRESEEQYRVLVESSPYGIFEVDCEGEFISMNAAGRRILVPGRTEDNIGDPLLDLTHSADSERVRDLLRRAAGGAPSEFECRTRDDRILQVSLVPNYDREKRAHLIGLVQEITERKRIEEVLKESENRYRDLFQNAHDLVYTTDLEGNFTSVNRAGCQLSGYDAEELLKLNISDVIAPEYVDLALQMIEAKKGGSATSNYELEVVTKTGLRVPLEVSTRLQERDGEARAIQGIARDLTERRRAEEERERLEAQLRHAQKMETVGTLAGGIAHDFNNILQAILGYSHMTLDDLIPGSRARDNLDHVIKAANRASDLVRQILTFSRQVEVERKPTPLQPIVLEALKLLRNSLPSTIEIRQRVEGSAPAIMADATQVHQVIMNLGTNAAHAMRGIGGRIEVSLDVVDLDSEFVRLHPNLEPGVHVRLTVSDSGRGMEESVRERVFEPFFTTKKGEGTGLGLSVVHGIVASHGGEITVGSERGRGTTFTIFFPSAGGEQSGRAQPLEQALRGRERILFVDDEEDLVILGKRMLQRLGYRVSTETSSSRALETFRSSPDRFDLVITDQTMPQMTGIQLAGHIAKVRSDIPIILTTGFSEVDAAAEALRQGVSEHLLKPVGVRALSQTIRRILDPHPERMNIPVRR